MPRLSVKQLAERHGVSRAIIYVWVEERRFPVYRLGAEGKRGRILIDNEAFVAFLDTQLVPPGQVQVSGPLIHIRSKN